MSDFTGIDLAAGDVRGMRVWSMDSWGRLTGVTHRAVWTPGENVAICRKDYSTSAYYYLPGEDRPDRCPGIASPKCGCGWWAYHYGGTDHSGDVAGVIQGYGKTTIGEKGFRCEKARILAFVVGGLAAQKRRLLSRNYPDVPQFPDVDAMVQAFPLSDEYAPSPDNTPDFWTRDPDASELAVSLAALSGSYAATMPEIRRMRSTSSWPTTGGFEIGTRPPGGAVEQRPDARPWYRDALRGRQRPLGLLLIAAATVASFFVPFPSVICLWGLSALGGMALGGAFGD